MKNISIFQLVVLGIFILLLAGGVIVVAIFSSEGKKDATNDVEVVIWGTLNASHVNKVIASVDLGSLNVVYVQKNEIAFDSSSIAEAIVSGRGPDAVLIRQDALINNLSKIQPIFYENYSARDFVNTFIQDGEQLLLTEGILAIPFAVDPLIMFWNRDIFTQSTLTSPPQYWDEVLSLSNVLTKKDSAGKIIQSAVALGEYDNIDNAKSILSAMFLQSGVNITAWNSRQDSVDVTLSSQQSKATSVLAFYTQFSDPRKSSVTWNKSLIDAQSMFASNRLGIYFGFASQAKNLRNRNPNLNFDVAIFPQRRGDQNQLTYGRLYSLALMKHSGKQFSAFNAIQAITAASAAEIFSSISGMPSVHKNLKPKVNDIYQSIFYPSALISTSWLDPNRVQSGYVFKNMVDSVISGFSNPSSAVGKAEQEMRYITN